MVVWLQFPKSGKGGQKMQRAKDARAKNAGDANAADANAGRSAWEIGKCIYIYIIFIIISY